MKVKIFSSTRSTVLEQDMQKFLSANVESVISLQYSHSSISDPLDDPEHIYSCVLIYNEKATTQKVDLDDGMAKRQFVQILEKEFDIHRERGNKLEVILRMEKK